MRDSTIDSTDRIRHATHELRTVANALRVMQQLADAEVALSVTDLASRLGLAPSTTHRILATLAGQGFAVRVPLNRRYRAGPALTQLARRSLLDHVKLGEAGRSSLERLASESGETSHLAVLDGAEALGIGHVESTQPVVARHPVGSRVPAHATAVGQAILAHLPDVVARFVSGRLAAYTPLTITDLRTLQQVMEEIRHRGYAINVGQLHLETAGVAAPIFDESGSVIASVGISGPSARIGDHARLERLAALALDGARDIRRRLADLDSSHHAPSEADSALPEAR